MKVFEDQVARLVEINPDGLSLLENVILLFLLKSVEPHGCKLYLELEGVKSLVGVSVNQLDR